MENKYLSMLMEIIGDDAKCVIRRPNKIGSCGGDTQTTFAYDIQFVD